VFGEQGYDRASTRKIAECAGVNTPAIRYYFGSKQGLHLACTRHIMGRLSSILAPPLARASDALRTTDPAAALGALCDLLVAVVDGLWVAGSKNCIPSLTCVTGDGGKPAQTVFHKHIGTELFDTMVRLIATATRDSSVATLARLRACVLLGYVSSLHENRAHTLAVMGWSEFDENALAVIKSIVREHTRGALATASAAKNRPTGEI
jgi:AcrR family transcriptional regulator